MATQALCVMLEQLGDNPDANIQDVNDFYSAVFEFGHLNEAEVLEFSEAERLSIVKSFPLAVQKAAKVTPELIASKETKELEPLLAKIKLVTNDLFEIFKLAVENQVPADLETDIQKLQNEETQIQQKLGK